MITQWIEAVCAEAGWPPPAKNGENKYRFRLEPDMKIDAIASDDRTLILQALITPLHRDHREVTLRRAATAVLPRVFRDSAVLSLDTETQGLYLHRVVTLGALRRSDFGDVMKRFIDDLAFYKSL